MTTLTVHTSLPKEQEEDLLAWMSRTLADDPALSPRTPQQLRSLLRRKHIHVVYAGAEAVGWVIRVPHTRQVQELAGAYLAPQWRGQGGAEVLLGDVLGRTRLTICTTGSPWLAEYLQRDWDFRRCGPGRLLRLTRGRIFSDRVSWRRLRHGRSYLRRIRLQFLYRDSAVAGQACPGCGTSAHDSFGTSDRAFGTDARARYARCGRCGHTWLVSGPPPTMLSEPQAPFAAWVMEHSAVARFVYAPRLRWLTRRVTIGKGTRLLDVGCGTAGFLRLVRDRTGASCQGVEADPALVRASSEVPVTLGDFLAVDCGEKFDVVTMFHVIEHFDDPKQAVRRAFDLVAPGGYLCIETPRSDCFARRIFGRYWFPLLPTFHRHVFSTRSLLRTLGEHAPGGQAVDVTSVFLPGEYSVSANLPFSGVTPHPFQRRRRGLALRASGALLALVVTVVALPLELASAILHRVLPSAGHVRVLLKKAAP